MTIAFWRCVLFVWFCCYLLAWCCLCPCIGCVTCSWCRWGCWLLMYVLASLGARMTQSIQQKCTPQSIVGMHRGCQGEEAVGFQEGRVSTGVTTPPGWINIKWYCVKGNNLLTRDLNPSMHKIISNPRFRYRQMSPNSAFLHIYIYVLVRVIDVNCTLAWISTAVTVLDTKYYPPNVYKLYSLYSNSFMYAYSQYVYSCSFKEK